MGLGRKVKDMMFHERYADFLDEICGDIDCSYNDSLLGIMFDFSEPQIIKPNRYDNFTYTTDAFKEALNEFNQKTGKHFHLGIQHNIFDNSPDNDSLSTQPIYFIFSIIELQHGELTEGEANEFTKEINQRFAENELPWKLVDGKLIKIDAQQFECDLKANVLEKMKELKDAEPKFKSAYIELTTAIESFEKGDYQSAINNAGKSYESVLKVILNADRGNADKLTHQYLEQILSVPDTMSKSGFREKVMMSLPFVRNNSGADHGAGSKEVIISKPMAKLAVNLAASLDTYLIDEYVLGE